PQAPKRYIFNCVVGWFIFIRDWTFSWVALVCIYANRVCYQVLNHNSPRLTRGLP
ncbi:hypothetical protein, partial [Enterobacter intestinihominis]